MSEPTFSELHPGAASTLTTGVDLAGTVANDQASQAQASLSAGMGGDAVILMAPPPKLASFSVYWDASAKTLKMYNPKVVYGAKTLDVAGADALDSGKTYYCVVKVAKSSGESESGTATETVTAELKNAMPDGSDDENTTIACVVPICAIDAKGHVTQYHVGAVVASAVSGGGAEYIAGDDTNIVFTPETGDDGTETGKIKVDVYYK